VQKQAPSLGRILVMAGFALSCFGLLLFLWLAFGGTIPLQPKGYRFNVAFKEAGTLSPEADVRISGVSVGKVKVIHADKKTGSSTRRSSSTPRTRRSRRTRRRSCARRRFWARPTSS
jgi:ABC-type transporter Mla subunit MlaD